MFGSNPTPKKRGQSRITPRLRSVPDYGESSGSNRPNPIKSFLLLIVASGTIFFIYFLYSGDKGSPTVINEEGEEVLSPQRQAKLERELDEIDNSVQYALIASINTYYPCFTCPDGSPTIFLYKGEIWRYGTTRKGKDGRYPNGNFGASHVTYVEQFKGTYSECLKMEKIKIYNYPLLPEAKKREVKLFRPPGNANDN